MKLTRLALLRWDGKHNSSLCASVMANKVGKDSTKIRPVDDLVQAKRPASLKVHFDDRSARVNRDDWIDRRLVRASLVGQ
jgi:hypothetical protein